MLVTKPINDKCGCLMATFHYVVCKLTFNFFDFELVKNFFVWHRHDSGPSNKVVDQSKLKAHADCKLM